LGKPSRRRARRTLLRSMPSCRAIALLPLATSRWADEDGAAHRGDRTALSHRAAWRDASLPGWTEPGNRVHRQIVPQSVDFAPLVHGPPPCAPSLRARSQGVSAVVGPLAHLLR
jgi:hypothetical protein